MESKALFYSSAVNQTNFGLDCWTDTSIVCYASSINLVVYDIKKSRVVGVSPAAHKDTVTCVRCVKSLSPDSPLLVLSTSCDETARLWQLEQSLPGSVRNILTEVAKYEGHKGAVSVADAIHFQQKENSLFVVTTGDDFVMKTWITNLLNGETSLCSTYSLPGRSLQLDVRLLSLSSSTWPVIISGGDNGKINLFTTTDLTTYTQTLSLPGHEDWVTRLDFVLENTGDILLASGAKDGLIRMWRISLNEQGKVTVVNTNDDENYELKVNPITLPVPLIETGDLTFTCCLEAVLQSHEGLVSDLCWISDNSKQENWLLSCAKTEDRSVILWKAEKDDDSSTGMWIEAARLGEVGGNREGFSCSKFVCGRSMIISVSYQGDLHLWKNINLNWEPQLAVSGHFDEVVDLSWDKKGRYLLTTSKDQTTRLFAEWLNSNGKLNWHELSRPQVHGYDMACITSLDDFRFACGAEEKVIRGFAAPANFLRNFANICSFSVDEIIDNFKETEGALIPSLGLSNKAVGSTEVNQTNDVNRLQKHGEFISTFKSLNLSEPPTADQLMQGTLWPEMSKLYGHGNEILSLASNSDGSLLASACRAKTSHDANIIIWNTQTWQQVGNLSHHNLSITQLSFSHDNKYLLSVSRDRSWVLYICNEGSDYKTFCSCQKKDSHARVIWSCCWIPNEYKFITGSRDKTVVIWKIQDQSYVKESTYNANTEVTAVDVTRISDRNILIAIGFVDGNGLLLKYDVTTKLFSNELYLSPCHKKTVRRLQFRNNSSNLLLASCGDDDSVWIYEIKE